MRGESDKFLAGAILVSEIARNWALEAKVLFEQTVLLRYCDPLSTTST